ncbi:MAG: sigma-70 family RNA polymerase sigma factor [Myxococcales bacterium]|nr:MAG: sigma-70 family RNA polymerase sigma factor [Myxococcales bacterium]
MSLLTQNRDLLMRFRNGETLAKEAVYKTYLHSVIELLTKGFNISREGILYRFHGYKTSYDLQNTVQETFARAFSESARLKYDGVRPYENYLLTIARNIVIDELRAATNKPNHFSLEDVSTGEYAAAHPTCEHLTPPDSQVEAAELARLVKEFLQTLSEEERRIVEERFQEGLSQRETATELTCSRMRVRTLEDQIRKKAIRFFKGSGYVDNLLGKLGVGGLWALAFAGVR